MYLRPYRKGDLDAMVALDLLCFEPQYRFSREQMRVVVEGTRTIAQVACEQEEQEQETMLGFAAAQISGVAGRCRGYVTTLNVAPSSRRQGVGGVLMLWLEAAAAQAGARAMRLHVACTNRGAISLYERLAYRVERRVANFYGEGDDAWLLGKALPSPNARSAGARGGVGSL